MTRQEVLNRLCELSEEIYRSIDPECQRPNDCFCGEGGFWTVERYAANPDRYQNAGHVVEFIEAAVREKLAREGSATGASL